MEPRRVRDFILRFYNGDINETFQQALRYYYSNKLETDVDKKKLGELIRLVEYKPKAGESKRKGLEREEKTGAPEAKRTATPEAKLEGPVAEQIEAAIEKLGRKNVFGPQEVEKTFGVRLAEVPDVPFSIEELERAEKLGQMLVLRVDKTPDGKPMSMEAMNEILVKKWKKEGKGEIFNLADGWKNWIGEEFFTKEHPRLGWALVSKDVLPESLSKNYLEQTEVIIKTLKEKAFKDLELPEEYTEAIAEFESKKKRLAELMDSDWEEAAKQLSSLKITQLTRQNIPEAVYDVAMYHDKNNERLLTDKYAWLSSLYPDGNLVYLGYFGAGGVSARGAWAAAGGGPTIAMAVSAFPFPADCNFDLCYLIL